MTLRGLLRHLREPTVSSIRGATMLVAVEGLFGCVTPSPALSPLHEAASRGDVEMVRSWVREKKNLDERYNDYSMRLEGNYSAIRGLTPLMVAARSGHLEIVKILTEGGANIYAES